jgi:molybdenum cofactor cytidylyltransferase
VITGIILAAGSSQRLGRPKQLLELAGKPVLQHVVDAAVAARLDEVLVVLGHMATDIAGAVPPRDSVRIAVNPRHAEGQSTSLRTGLRAANVDSDAAVVLLGDQPGIRADAIEAVVRAWLDEGGPVVQASYGGHPAHPTLFERSIWQEIEGAIGDEGARGILGSHPEWRRLVEVGGVVPDDIDTEDDYARVRASFEGRP